MDDDLAAFSGRIRQLQDGEKDTMNCDGAFLGCMGNSKCSDCFRQINDYEIDWANVAQDTPCEEVVSFLQEEKLCVDIKGDPAATAAFCLTFHKCAFWTDKDNKDGGDNKDEKDEIDCSKLTECKWEGMHESFIGDGICHENLGECYNTAICNW